MKNTLLILLVVCSTTISAQHRNIKKVATIGFLNVENLWDTIRSADYIDGTRDPANPAFHRSIPLDSLKFLEAEKYNGSWSDGALIGKRVVRYQRGSDEFTPESTKNYTTAVYRKKIENSAKVISELGSRYTKTAPVIVGLIEVENRQVIQDLIKHPALSKYDYGIVHYNSYDPRGIDIALIYQRKRFTVTNALKKELKIYSSKGIREYTRDILVVSGILDNEKVGILMNHWPSRRGGEVVSSKKRNAAASLLKQQMDSIRTTDPSTKLFAMGDFNDDPVSASLKNYLNAAGKEKDLCDEKPYLNLMYPLYKKGVASLAYQDAPNLFDQIIISKNLVLEKNPREYSVYRVEIYAPPYLINKKGNYKGYPFRSWNGDQFTGGYSDHFPAFVVLQKEQ
nr:endonuclease [uncultured Chryseobacterium sp.]